MTRKIFAICIAAVGCLLVDSRAGTAVDWTDQTVLGGYTFDWTDQTGLAAETSAALTYDAVLLWKNQNIENLGYFVGISGGPNIRAGTAWLGSTKHG